ncbi:hypothetical protein Tco_0542364 [Tanacetum coccineum]
MHQRRWIELFSDYEYEIRYYLGKVNVVADALSRKERVKPRHVRAMAMTIQYGIRGMILAAQGEAFKQENVLAKKLHGLDQQMERREDGSLYFLDRIWVPLVGGVRMIIIDETHKTMYSVHPRADKMSPVLWVEIGESSLIGSELVQETTDKVVLIKEKLKAAKDRQKSYADNRRVMRFGKKGKLAPRYVGPFEILERIGPVAYRLRLHKELSEVYDTFHVSNLKKCLADANLHVPLDEIKVDKTLHFVEKPVEIMEREITSILHLWSMKMRQYIAITDHILWDIITNGDQATTDPASSHLLSFHDATNAKTLWSAIKARFGGNEASKKMQNNLLKQQFETFTIGSREELDSAYERFQNILSMLELYDAKVSLEDANLKFLRSLPSV